MRTVDATTVPRRLAVARDRVVHLDPMRTVSRRQYACKAPILRIVGLMAVLAAGAACRRPATTHKPPVTIALKLDEDDRTGTVRFSNVFGDHMVLQRGKPIHLWGLGVPQPGTMACLGPHCTPAVVTAQQKRQSGDMATNTQGGTTSWRATLPACTATAAPLVLMLRSASNTTLQQLVDVVVGDVLLFSVSQRGSGRSQLG